MARRLFLSYFSVILLTVVLLAFMLHLATNRSFSHYVQHQATVHHQMLPVMLAGYFAGRGNWDGVQQNIDEAGMLIGAPVTLVNTRGYVVAATQRELVGQPLAPTDHDHLMPVMVSGGVTVGTVYIGRTAAQQQADAAFLADVTHILIIAGLTAALAAVMLGIWFSRSLSRPLTEMAYAAQRIAQGDYNVHVVSRTHGEVATLAHAFNQMAAGLNSLERLRRELVSNVSHDLRTPLTVIRGYLEGLRSGQIADRRSAERAFESMHAEVTHLLTLVDDLRDVAMLDAESCAVERLPTALPDLLVQTLTRIQPVAEQKGVAFRNLVPSQLPPIAVDPARIGQAFFNLLENAIRHTPPGGLITLRGGQVGMELWIAVQDSGDGIPPGHLPHIFERFYRVDHARSRAEGGSGLGLSIVASIVAAHGGRVSADSDGVPGHGSTFTVTLPL